MRSSCARRQCRPGLSDSEGLVFAGASKCFEYHAMLRSVTSTTCLVSRTPWPFARVADHDRLDADVAQRDVELLRLGDRHVVVVLAVHEHRRRLDLVDVAERRALPQQVHQPLLVRERAELDRQVVVVVRHVVEADQVGDARGRHGRLEAIGLRDQPVGELPAVAAAFDAEPVRVDPRILGERGVDAGQDVLGLARRPGP